MSTSTKLISAAFFLMTLQSYYFYSINLAAFTYIGVFFFFAYYVIVSGKIKFSRRNLLVLAFGLLIFSACGLIYYNNIKSITGIFFGFIVYFIVSIYIMSGKSPEIYKALNLVVSLHVFAWGFQLLFWCITGDYLDYLQPITGEAQRFFSPKGLMLQEVRIPRFTGLFNEPGTYSNVIFVLVSCLTILDNKPTKLVVFSVLSMLGSLSFYGFVFSLIIISKLYFNRNNFKYLIGLPVIFVPFVSYIYDTIIVRINSSFSGVEDRQDAYNLVYESMVSNKLKFFFGTESGDPLGVDLNFALNDLSFFVSTVYSYGIIGVLFILYFFIIPVRNNKSSIALIAFVLLSKIKITFPLVWIFLAILKNNHTKRLVEKL